MSMTSSSRECFTWTSFEARWLMPESRASTLRKPWLYPGVLAVITGKDLEQYNLAWMPTLMGDTQMVLPVDTVKFDGQEVAAVLATDRYTAADGVSAVDVEYEPLPVVVDPFKALEPDSPNCSRRQRGKKVTTSGTGRSVTGTAPTVPSARAI